MKELAGVPITAGSPAEVVLEALAVAQRRFAAMSSEELAINTAMSVGVIVLAAAASWLIGWANRKLSGIGRSVEKFAPLTVNLLNLLIWAAAGCFVLRIWGIDLMALAAGAAAGAFGAQVLRVGIALAVVLAAWEGVAALIARPLRRRAQREADPRRGAQLLSFIPLITGLARGVVIVIGALFVLAQLGIDLAPLLAGAGVVSLAVAFGAQGLLKDYLTGFSIVLEDIAAIGDVIRIEESSGVVEAMTLRTIQLRAFDGTLHVIPYSQAQVIHNLTKTFSYYVFDLSVSYDTDIDLALRIMRTVGEEMQTDPDCKDLILAPLEVFGVDKLADSGVILKARFKTLPSKQWDVGREYNRRVKLAFDAAGVEIPFPHVKLVVAGQPAAG